MQYGISLDNKDQQGVSCRVAQTLQYTKLWGTGGYLMFGYVWFGLELS